MSETKQKLNSLLIFLVSKASNDPSLRQENDKTTGNFFPERSEGKSHRITHWLVFSIVFVLSQLYVVGKLNGIEVAHF